MQQEVDVLIIGGGIAGVSTLYHLMKMGCTDSMLVEKLELTSGSTWHAAGNLPHFSNSYSVMKMQQYSINLYQRLQSETGRPVDHHRTGAIRLAHSQDRMDEFKRVAAMSELAGLHLQVITTEQLEKLYPFLNTTGLQGGLWDPDDGHIDPTSVTHAMAASAKQAGANIIRNTAVEAIKQLNNGRWQVLASKGVITAKVVVNAAGFRANEIAAMIGHQLPIVSMEHQFVVTDNIAELEQREQMLPMLRDPDISYYLRQEGKGLLLGPYEKNPVPWASDGIPPEFGQELLQPDLDRIEHIMCTAMEQVDLIAKAGIKTIINGPITYTPDGHPLIGPVTGYKNCFVCSGFNFGIVQGGGAGYYMAQWIINGSPNRDLFELDPRRFGRYTTSNYTLAKATEVYANEYQLGFPHEYAMRPAGRGIKKSPVYSLLQKKHAVFAANYGWEQASWFAPSKEVASEIHSFKRGNWFNSVTQECKNVQNNVGIVDLSSISKFKISGSGAFQYLQNISPHYISNEVGDVIETYPLTMKGTIAWQCSITILESQNYYLTAPTAAEAYIQDWLISRLPVNGSVTLENVTQQYGTLIIAGPYSRNVLSSLTNTPLNNKHFPCFHSQEIQLSGITVRANRIHYIGDIAWEIHHTIDQQLPLYNALMAAGKKWHIGNFGMRAMNAMRMENGYPIWGYDLLSEYNLLECNVIPHVIINKGSFEGKAALQLGLKKPLKLQRVLLEILDTQIDAIGMEPIYSETTIVGHTSSGSYGYRTQKSLAMAYINPEVLNKHLTIKILGQYYNVSVTSGCVYDKQSLLITDDH